MLTTLNAVRNVGIHRPTLALLMAGVSATIVLGVLPMFVAGMVADVNGGDREVGWLASADMMGSALASLCFIPFVRRVRWRPAACAAIALVIVGNVAAARADTFDALMYARIVAGAGNGVILSIAFVGLCRSTHPDRYFGLYTFSQLGLQAASLSVFPIFLAAYGLDALYLVLAALATACLVLVPSFPRSAEALSAAPAGVASPRPLSRGAVTALLAQGVYFLAPGAVWGYFERIGQSFDLTLAAIGQALGVAALLGIAGAAAVALGVRGSRLALMAVGTGLSVAAMALLITGAGFAAFMVAAAMFSFAWNFTFPYQMGALASVDRSGVAPILSLLVQLAGLALGPVAASFFDAQNGHQTLLLGCVGCYVISLALFRLSGRLDD